MKISPLFSNKKFTISVVVSAFFVFWIAPILYDWLPYKIISTKDRSLPWRIWIASPPLPHYQRGEYIEIEVFFKNQYVENVRFLIKQVACRGGDHLRTQGGVFYCNGEEIARAQPKDSAGRPMSALTYDGPIPERSYFVLASHSMSYDSRYYGLVEEKHIVHRVWPVL